MLFGVARLAPSDKTLTLGFVGDIMLGRQVNSMIKKLPPTHAWGTVLPLLHKTDFLIGNLETTFTTGSTRVPKVFNFKADPALAKALKAGHFTVVNLANNHSLDFSRLGFFETLKTLDRLKIEHVGAGKNVSEARKIAVIERPPYRIGVLGVTDNEPTWAASAKKPGTHYRDTASVAAQDRLCLFIKKQKKAQKLDLLILSIHWGPNMRLEPDENFVAFAHKLVDAGVDILHGHSAHVLQGVEAYKNGLILYDTGDFVDDYAIDPILRNDIGALFLVSYADKKITKLEIVPTLISNYQVNLAMGSDFEFIAKRLTEQSLKFGTMLKLEPGKAVVANLIQAQ